MSTYSIARIGALLMIGASATLGTVFAFKLGAAFGLVTAIAMAAMALGGEILKPIAVEAAFAHGLRRPLRMLTCLLVAGVALAYSFAAEIAVSAGGRDDLVAQREAGSDARKTARTAAKRASDELASLKPARPVDELEALVADAREVCRIEVNLKRRRTVCSKPPALLAELGRAKRRAELEGQLLAAETRQVAAGPAGEADPQAAAVTRYLAAAGWKFQQADVATWLPLLPVLLLEIGSAFGLLVARGAGTPAGTAAGSGRQLPAGVLDFQKFRRQLRRQPAVDARHPVVVALEKAGRPLSVAELGQAMGVTAAEASKRWREPAVVGSVAGHRHGKFVLVSLRGATARAS